MSWEVAAEYERRPQARGDAWVYRVARDGAFWGVLVDEEVGKSLFAPNREDHPTLDEVIVPLMGFYWVHVDGWERTLRPGEAAIIPRGVAHDSGIATNTRGTRILVLLLDAGQGALADAAPGGVRLPEGSLDWLSGAFRYLRQVPDGTSVQALAGLPGWLAGVAAGERLPADETLADALVQQMLPLLQQPDTPSLGELAEAFGLTESHLQRRFRQAVGSSPLQYALGWRLDRVAEALRAGNTLPLVDLATRHGFGDMKHFRARFKQRFGITPSAYRKNPPPSPEGEA